MLKIGNFASSIINFVKQPISLTQRIARLEQKIDLLEYYSHGARAVYLGDSRVLLKVVVFGSNIAFLLESDDLLLTPWFIASGRYESSLTNWLVPRIKPESVCIDVGANFGYFTCLFARFAHNGRVIGVEPDPKVFALLRDNVLINGFNASAQVVNAAAGDGQSEITLFRRMGRSGNTSVVEMSEAFTSSLGEDPVVPFQAKGVTVDDLARQLGSKVDFLKVDVEGAEPLVFRGAKEVIEANRGINIVFEWSPQQITAAGFNLGEFLDFLRDCGLRAFCLDEAGRETATSFDQLRGLPYMAGVVLRRG